MVNFPLVPVKGSVPAWTSVRYREDWRPWLCSKYAKKSIRSPEKVCVDEDATKLYTCMFPFLPDHSSHDIPPMVVDAMAFPVDEMGPAPPRAASQTMISYSALPSAVEDRNMSYATSATKPEPE